IAVTKQAREGRSPTPPSEAMSAPTFLHPQPVTGMAIPGQNQPHSLEPLIENYPHIVEGREIWSAIGTRV
ncbi:Lox4p, partial [Sarracenia purpurea var. burkii]